MISTEGNAELLSIPQTGWQRTQGEGASVPLKLSSQIGSFAGHIFFGTSGFIILAVPAIIFSASAEALRATSVPGFVILTLVGLHYFLFTIDIIVFIAYISVSVYAAAIELIKYVKSL